MPYETTISRVNDESEGGLSEDDVNALITAAVSAAVATEVAARNTAITTAVAAQDTATKNALHPVGSIYINATSSTNPATLLGMAWSTWVAWGAGRTIVAYSASDTEFDAAEETGGAKTHTLSSSEMPSHTHTGTTSTNGNHNHQSQGYWLAGSGAAQAIARSTVGSDPIDTNSLRAAGDHSHTFTTASAGSGSAHNNLQPYIVARGVWKRTV